MTLTISYVLRNPSLNQMEVAFTISPENSAYKRMKITSYLTHSVPSSLTTAQIVGNLLILTFDYT